MLPAWGVCLILLFLSFGRLLLGLLVRRASHGGSAALQPSPSWISGVALARGCGYLASAPPPGSLGSCPLGACLSGWPGVGGPWGARPTGVGAGGAVVLWGRSGLTGSLPRREFELGATAPGALREGLLFILAGCRPSRRRRSVSESSGRLSTAVRMSRLAFGAPGCGGHAGGACPSTALKDRHSSI